MPLDDIEVDFDDDDDEEEEVDDDDDGVPDFVNFWNFPNNFLKWQDYLGNDKNV